MYIRRSGIRSQQTLRRHQISISSRAAAERRSDMQIFTCILLGFLIVCAVSVSLSKNLLNSILIYMSYSLIMSIIWILLESPDLAITEAAVGAGITSVLFFVTLKKIHAMVDEDAKNDAAGTGAVETGEAAGHALDGETGDVPEGRLCGKDAASEKALQSAEAVSAAGTEQQIKGEEAKRHE